MVGGSKDGLSTLCTSLYSQNTTLLSLKDGTHRGRKGLPHVYFKVKDIYTIRFWQCL